MLGHQHTKGFICCCTGKLAKNALCCKNVAKYCDIWPPNKEFNRISMKIRILLALLFAYPLIADAYVDPGIGSTIFQAIIAGIIGGVYLAKVYWFKIVGLFSRIRNLLKK